MPPIPPRSPARGNADSSHGSRPPYGGFSRPGASNGESDYPLETGSFISDFYAAALDGAMALVRADGGEIATLDETRQVLVLRARRSRPRLDSSLGPVGIPGRSSQPLLPPLPSHPGALASYAGTSAPLHRLGASAPSIADETTPLDEIEIQSTQLLPATLNSRTYRKGERLIGLTWERAEPAIMRGEDVRAIPGGSAPPDPEAPWHLAMPVLRPSSLAVTRPHTDVIGVISVYNKDPLWSFSIRDVELLALHADRVARGMLVAELAGQSQSQAELLNVLVSDLSDPTPHSLYLRLRDVVRRLIDAPSFAVVLYDAKSGDVSFEIAERDGQPVPLGQHIPASALPPWWRAVCEGQTVRISAPEEHAQHPELCALGWGGDAPAQSILATPLVIGNEFRGAMVAGSPRLDVYLPEHSRLFTTVARSAAILIENARLGDNMRRALVRASEKELQLARLNNAVLTVNASLDVDETLRALARQAAALTEAKICVALLFDDAHEYLIGRAASGSVEGTTTPLSQTRVPATWRHLDKTIESGQFMLMDHLEQEWEDGTEIGRLLKEFQMHSCLVLPLVDNDTPLGVLVVYTPGQRYHFMPEEIGLLQGLVSQGTMALSNATIFERSQQVNREQQEWIRKQQELDRMKEDFILTVSHEFRTPVTAIDGYVTLINRHLHKLDQDKLDQFTAEIRQASQQLMGMIERLHAASTVEGEPLPASIQPINLYKAAEDAIASLTPEAKDRMMLDVPENLFVQADADRLLSVFSNLFSNATKYSPASKPVHITARVEERGTLAEQRRPHALADDAPARWVVVTVRDWGDGISEEDQTHLFQKFVRLSRSLTTSVRGTGLGLWICRRYLEVMGGDIWVESEYGFGASFLFSLPLATQIGRDG